MRPRLKGALLLTVAFVLGLVAGGFGAGVLQSRWGWHAPWGGPRFQQRMLHRLDRELGLTAAQREQIDAIIRETRQEVARLREELGPRFRDVRLRTRARIREVLDPAQRDKFDALAARWEQWGPRGGGGPPGPPWGR